MAPALADALIDLLALHVAAGALFAIAFHSRGIARVDAAAAESSLGFRVLVTPGVVALWPLLVRRWWMAARGEPGS